MFSTLSTGARFGCACVLGGSLFTACLDRPVVPQSPQVTARFVSGDNQSVISKIDLLFLIDNSQSMADKQSFLALAVPNLLGKLINPACVDTAGQEVRGVLPDPVTHLCPPPTRRDFEPVNDIHIGMLSSSLGAHGADIDPSVSADDRPCAGGAPVNDGAHLLSRGPSGTIPTFGNAGFLDWNPDLAGAFSDEGALRSSFASLVSGVGQAGCGYESQLEAVYRFLNDPAPYRTLAMVNGRVEKRDVDTVLLQQRSDFLRPDSMVVVISITDENDYSIADEGQGWIVLRAPIKVDGGARSWLEGGTSICKTNPNDRCCYNCGQMPIPAGCPSPDNDPECRKGFLTSDDDPANLRATRSKFQYGIDFANPIERYVDGFSQPILSRFENGAKNPLYDDLTCKNDDQCQPPRDPSLVFFAGIVGVPWQDIAIDPAQPSLGFQAADALVDKGTWDLILGDPEASPPVPPGDPHMLVSVDPRPGIPGPDSALAADPKNGHEWDPAADAPAHDLQYACTFKLPTPRDCNGAGDSCDCADGKQTRNPLCQDPATGTYGTMQYRAKAYPGIRELQVLKGIGSQGIVASICPANSDHPEASDFGYGPVMNTVLDRLRVKLRGRCLPHALGRRADGTVPCILMEAFTPKDGAACTCSDPAFPGRTRPTSDSLTADVVKLGPCICEIQPLAGDAQTACERGDAAFGQESGWCYVDPLESRDPRQCDLVKECPATQRRILRYFGAAPRGRVVTMCQEQAFSPEFSPARGEVCAVP
jgi:hypothetical protein